MNRRQFLTTTGAFGAWSASVPLSSVLRGESAGGGVAPLKPGRITLEGKLVHECSLPGEKRSDGVFPAHPNGIRLSKDRVLLLYATRGWRGVDEDRSIIYQVRLGGFTGPILKEGLLAQSRDDWDPFNDGSRYFQAHGHPSGFGVPKGALIDGQPAPHANLFVIKWYSYSRYFVQPDRLALTTSDPRSVHLSAKTIHMEWVQVRLNEAEDDIETVDPISTLQTPGVDPRQPESRRVNQTYVQPVPYNRETTEWIDMAVVGWSEKLGEKTKGPVAVKYRYDPQRHRYAWVEKSGRLFPPGIHAGEGGAIKTPAGWAMFVRPTRRHGLPLLWAIKEDPFDSNPPDRLLAGPREGQPIVRAPVTAYRCADGKIRVFTGDSDHSPYDNRRNPLYAWECDDTADFALSRRQTVIDVLTEFSDVRLESEPIADMAKVLPHCGGSSQYVAFRLRTESINYDRIRKLVPKDNPRHLSPAVTDGERMAHGIYVARIDYDRAMPDEWEFA
ncbi:MAG: hypothetical protein H7A44_08240 [Opitutaceae bacterium]|nr:hypothetical protein [Cephaloticoccus sp.]MCP5530419.1 hypothetical protein [Opitutaceae bacterium]